MPIITLTTDWKNSDYYIGAVKGRILKNCANANIIDISHQIGSFNILQASIVLRNSYTQFPDKTVHVIGVSESAKSNEYLVVEAHNQFFVGADNGIFGLLFDEEPTKIVSLDKSLTENASTFVTLNVLAEAATMVANGKKLEQIGQEKTDYLKSIPIMPAIEESMINGSVVYIDSFSNAITNINRELFIDIGKQRAFEIFVQSNHYKLNTVKENYYHVPVGELVAVFNSADLLEIAINQGNAAELLNLSVNSAVRVKFFEGTSMPQLKLFNN